MALTRVYYEQNVLIIIIVGTEEIYRVSIYRIRTSTVKPGAKPASGTLKSPVTMVTFTLPRK